MGRLEGRPTSIDIPEEYLVRSEISVDYVREQIEEQYHQCLKAEVWDEKLTSPAYRELLQMVSVPLGSIRETGHDKEQGDGEAAEGGCDDVDIRDD